MGERFNKQKYVIRKRILKLIRRAFDIYDLQGYVCFYVEGIGVYIRFYDESKYIRFYGDESKQDELLIIEARKRRNIIDFSLIYDVIDSKTGKRVGALRRKELESFIQVEWEILDVNDQILGFIKEEDNLFLALIRSLLPFIRPKKYAGYFGDKMVWHFKRNFNPFVPKMFLDMSYDSENIMDNRMGIAAAVLLFAIEG